MRILIILLLSSFLIHAYGQNTCTEKVFIHEYAAKIMGQCILVFEVIQDSTIQIGISYKIIYKDSMITKISKWTDTTKHKVFINKDCTLSTDDSDVMFYDSHGFMINNFNNTMYSLIDMDFMSLTNELKIERLEKLIARLKEKE